MTRKAKPLLPEADERAFERICAHLNPEWIERALAATGTASVRRRRLPAEQVLWLVLGMAIYRDRPIAELAERLDLVLGPNTPPARSAVAQARARVGPKPLEWLFSTTARKCFDAALPEIHLCRPPRSTRPRPIASRAASANAESRADPRSCAASRS